MKTPAIKSKQAPMMVKAESQAKRPSSYYADVLAKQKAEQTLRKFQTQVAKERKLAQEKAFETYEKQVLKTAGEKYTEQYGRKTLPGYIKEKVFKQYVEPSRKKTDKFSELSTRLRGGRTIQEERVKTKGMYGKAYQKIMGGTGAQRAEKLGQLRKKLGKQGWQTRQKAREFKRATAGVGGLLRAFGVPVTGGVARGREGTESWKYQKRYAHPGRPMGTFKYGMPIRQWQRLQNQKKALAKLQSMKEEQEMVKKGYSGEQIQNMRRQKIAQQYQPKAIQEQQIEMEMPMEMEQPIQQQVTSTQEDLMQNFQRELQMQSITPNTQRILDQVRAIQTKGARDNANMQRVLRERKMVSQATELVKAPSLFGPESNTFNVFDETFNPLKAPNVFAAREDNNIMRKRTPFNIMNTREAGNDLKW